MTVVCLPLIGALRDDINRWPGDGVSNAKTMPIAWAPRRTATGVALASLAQCVWVVGLGEESRRVSAEDSRGPGGYNSELDGGLE